MKKESKLNLNAGDYAISHCDSDKTYNGLEVHKMLCDAYIAGNNDTLDDEAYRKAYYDGYNKCNRDWIYSQEAEQEKYDFVSGRFIECRKSFNEFKEGNSYWLEYIGDDTYVGRSDNILNKKFHITPQQLFTLFTKQHYCSKKETQGKQKASCTTIAETGDGGINALVTRELSTNDEQKSAEVESKFNVGDWVVKNGVNRNPIQITSFEEDKDVGVKVWFSNGTGTYVEFLKGYHKWTIQDAKDGDVLKEDSCIFILEKIKSQDTAITHCCLFDDGDFNLSSKICFDVDSTYPATKEQRDTLLKAMADAGYIFDFEKKKLKNIVQKTEENNGNIGGISPNWSEEDERLCQCLIEDQKETLDKVRNNKYGHSEIISDLKEMYHERIDWLKSLKGRVHSKQEWSNVDKDILFRTINDLKFLRDTISIDPKYAVNIIDMEREITWLKSLRPQNKWKPSDNELEVLRLVAEKDGTCLMGLYEQLKKLKED